MVLEGIIVMKRFLFIFLGIVMTFVLGTIISIPLHNLFSGYFINSHDDENKLVGFVLFVEWPAYLIIGAIIGSFMYKKYLTRQINSDS